MKHCPNLQCDHRHTTGTAGEFRDEIELCTDCGTKLVHGEPPDPHAVPEVRWAAALESDDPGELSMARMILQSESIPTQMGPGRLLVPESFLEHAVLILRHTATGEEPLPEDWEGQAEPAGEQADLPAELAGLESSGSDDHSSEVSGLRMDISGAPELRNPAPPADSLQAERCPECQATFAPSTGPSRGGLRALFRRRRGLTCPACGTTW